MSHRMSNGPDWAVKFILFSVFTALCESPVRCLPTLQHHVTNTSIHGAVSLPDIHGRDVAVFPLKQPQWTAIIFIARECPISNKYTGEINRLCHAFEGKPVRFLLIYVETEITADQARKHHKDFGFSCAAVIDKAHKLVEHVGAKVTPEAAILDHHGRVRYRGRIDNLYPTIGTRRYEATTHDLRDALKQLIAGKPVKVSRTEAVGCFISG